MKNHFMRNNMKILIVNRSDREGGAARAAYRLHTSLLANNIDCQMLVESKSSDDFTVSGPMTQLKVFIWIWMTLKKSAKKISQLFDDETYREASINARKRYENNFKTENIAPLVLEEITGVKA